MAEEAAGKGAQENGRKAKKLRNGGCFWSPRTRCIARCVSFAFADFVPIISFRKIFLVCFLVFKRLFGSLFSRFARLWSGFIVVVVFGV